MSDYSIELAPSELGTKEHWDNVYSSELSNFEEIGDEGEIWFGEDSVEKMVKWAMGNVPPETAPFVLEVGAGNGNLLFALRKAGYAADRICGVDYSEDAVKLAQAIATSREHADEADGDARGTDAIHFAVCDFLREDVPLLRDMPSQHEGPAIWDLVLDKGTFDAMALAGKDQNGISLAESYPTRVERVVKPGGFFLITSCNFTEEELKSKFTIPETRLRYHSTISFPTFSFGGKSGNVYSSVAFEKAD
ncbi:S-adenosyl-L-methionine-dependent methyltransferase [Laetiporus sulphureus 93-53]|uniref:Protein-lysine N-methyltransferase EFM4 n=1 Tax=Laetiporus sulphureus 93-53 TaxID=1314785 RepID=A0A165BDD1_9APHY|nr:S-adenosyl-L-methionine-dependent methyltransferase [Laetiporus sulphureus 93-53]KZT00797.1 S-adenosyl-L-methionine-dependent methyltransferase [Laetiporus sulphureus 93-53]